MTIEGLLCHLEAELERSETEYRDYYEKLVKANKEIRRYYEDPFLSPDEIPEELLQEAADCYHFYSAILNTHNRILDAINIIKERVGG